MSRRLAAILVILLGLVEVRALPLTEPVPLPADVSIDRNTVEIDLRQGRVDVTIDDQTEPSFTVDDILRGDQTEGFVLIGRDVVTLSIGQPHGADEQAPRLHVNLNIHSNQHIRITGTDLVVSVERTGMEKPQDDRGPRGGTGNSVVSGTGQPSAPLLRIDPNDSDIQVRGVDTLVLGGSRNRIILREIDGLVQAKLERGTLTLEDQQGDLTLRTHDTDLGLTRVAGRIESALEGGQLTVSESQGALQVNGSSAAVVLDQWSGPARIAGEMLHVEARNCSASDGTLRIEGLDHDVVLEDVAATLDLDLRGGHVVASRLSGAVQVSATQGARLAFKGLKASTKLRLQDGASAKVEGAEQPLSGQIDDAQLDCAAVRDLDLRVSGGGLAAREVRGQAHVVASDAELDLDLVAVTGYPALVLSGRTTARITLRDPCIVRLDGHAEDAQARLHVTGCEYQGADGRPSAQAQLRRDGGRPPAVLMLKVDELAQADIRGEVQ